LKSCVYWGVSASSLASKPKVFPLVEGGNTVPKKESNTQPAYLRLVDAAAYTSLSAQMLLKLHSTGVGTPRIKKGRAVLYSIKAPESWMERDQEAA
jgi:hypothetical protein